jgi:hypothetical protein
MASFHPLSCARGTALFPSRRGDRYNWVRSPFTSIKTVTVSTYWRNIVQVASFPPPGWRRLDRRSVTITMPAANCVLSRWVGRFSRQQDGR